ncbi:MAG TPA: DUF2911 domain-containing protein [Verrucomicrobiae bacterium]|nr:DUF2911 domain-containing protein [Verrucomicrobiae bacterium]
MNLKVTCALVIFTGCLLAPAAIAQTPNVEFPAPSPASTLKQRVGLTDVEIAYSRPSMRGRRIFGAMIPYGEVWRTGANTATRVSFSTDVTLQGAALAAGDYELFTIPGRDEWTIIVQKRPEKASWGAYSYKQENDTARVTARPTTLASAAETLAIGIADLHDTGATVYIEWENTRVPLQLQVDTVGILMPRIKAAIASDGPKSWNLYYGAAALLYDNGGDLEQSLAWVEESLKLRGDYPPPLLLQTRLLAKLGRHAEAKAAAEKTVAAGFKVEGPGSVMARQAQDIADSLK